ncbi:tRNA 2-thiouridine(34) synthase MnmA [Patescibacteria group bacterium]
MIKNKIIVAMSGGIDSSMTAFLLKQKGWQPFGLTLDNINNTKAIKRAKKLCKKINIPHQVYEVKKDFQKQVIDYFNKELEKGNTPNPCVICNRFFKFAKVLSYAKDKNINYVATGHFAKIKAFKKNSKISCFKLLQAKDKDKDQSYYLSFLEQKVLRQIVFPLGDYTKKEIYVLAKKQGFNFLVKTKSSQDLCFLEPKQITSYKKQILGLKPGKIVNSKGKILGNHQGLHFFTIGQRKGINISGGPFYVLGFNKRKNLLIVTRNKKNLLAKQAILFPYNFISGQDIKKPVNVLARVRYQQPLQKATLFPSEKGKLKILFKSPQMAITPGQFAVFYEKDVCLGGGKIVKLNTK